MHVMKNMHVTVLLYECYTQVFASCMSHACSHARHVNATCMYVDMHLLHACNMHVVLCYMHATRM